MDAAAARYRQFSSEVWREHVAVGAAHGTDIGAHQGAGGRDLEELLPSLGKQRLHTSRSALARFLDRHKTTRKKKSLQATEQQRKDMAQARRKWIREQGLLDPATLVFIEETSVNTNIVRL
jgi:hypothetical protein